MPESDLNKQSIYISMCVRAQTTISLTCALLENQIKNNTFKTSSYIMNYWTQMKSIGKHFAQCLIVVQSSE